MARRRRAAAAAALVLFAAGVAPAGDDERIARGAAAVAHLKSQLMAALQEGLTKGPEAAIDVCRIRAPELAAGLATARERVGRTSHKLRNPENAPAPWMEPILAAYLADPSDRAPRVAELGEGRIGYAEPLFVQAPCLVCHGESIADPVRSRIEALYPDDRATGFREGDFRGIAWAELTGAE